MTTKPKIAFVGLTHLGLVTSIGMTCFKKDILALDVRNEIIESLRNGNVLLMEGEEALQETDLDKLFKKNKDHYFPTTNFKELTKVNTIFFAVDTPTDGKGSLDNLNHLIDLSIPYLKNNSTIIVMSQVPIGFCRSIKNRIINKRPNLKFSLYHWVDTIIMTNAIDRFIHPERIIIGKEDDRKFNTNLRELLKLFDCPVYDMSYEGAEITKAFINLYLANSITFANTLSDYCEKFNANINEIIPALRSDKRIGQYAYIKPTLSIAGGHLERDLIMLEKIAKQKGVNSKLISLIIKENTIRYKWAIEKITKNVSFFEHRPTICLWGLAYKKDTSSVKNAASQKILKHLSNKYLFRVYDPMAIIPKSSLRFERLNDKYKAVKNADCLVILTDWEEFKNADLKKLAKTMKHKNIIDAVGSLSYLKSRLGGFNYQCMGIGTN